MKSSTVWHGHSTRLSLPAGTARKANGHLSGRRPLHLANARPFGRSKAPLGLLLLRKRELALAGRTGSSHPQQRETERSRRGTPCCTYRYRMWIFQGASIQGAPCILFCLTFPCSAVLFSLPTDCKHRPQSQTSRTQTTPCRCPWCG